MNQILKLALAMLAAGLLLAALLTGGCFVATHWPPWEPEPPAIVPDHNEALPRSGIFVDND